jgi:alpha/beta superfamily hydrolase
VSFRPPAPQPIRIDGPAGPLEAILEEPLEAAAAASFAVICHPHPQHGGTMTNKVVHTLARCFQRLGAATVRFNFRGVGASAGAWDEGRGELADALAVIAWGRARWPGRPLWLGGFSFGAWIAARAAGQAAPARLVTVAPPVTRFDFGDFLVPQCPWLIVQGEADELVDAGQVRAWVRALQGAVQLRVLPGVDHFFHGHLGALSEAVLAHAGGESVPPAQ